MNKKTILFFIGILILLTACSNVEKDFSLTPTGKTVKDTDISQGTEVGTGYSTAHEPKKAVTESVSMALEGKTNKNPEFAIVYASSGSDLDAILSELKSVLPNTKIYGGTADSRAVMTEKGFVKVTEKGYESSKLEGKRGLAVMTVDSKDITFGVGSADFEKFDSIQEAAETAIKQASISAEKTSQKQPNLILISITQGNEEEALKGIENVFGKDVVVLGGTVGGPSQSVFGKEKTHEKGISVAVIYTDLPVGWTFEGGFDTKLPNSGIVTKVDGQHIVEIDNKPALDVYNEWLNGKIDKLYAENKDPGKIRDLLTLYPIYRKYTSPSGQDYHLFSHPWPKDDTLENRAVSTSTEIKKGEKIYLSKGTWETLINRIGNLPKNAKSKGDITIDNKPILGIGYFCAGVMGTIPVEEREKLSTLINYANNNAPFIASFTWGEQGHFPGVGNKHGNLLTSFVVIGKGENI